MCRFSHRRKLAAFLSFVSFSSSSVLSQSRARPEKLCLPSIVRLFRRVSFSTGTRLNDRRDVWCQHIPCIQTLNHDWPTSSIQPYDRCSFSVIGCRPRCCCELAACAWNVVMQWSLFVLFGGDAEKQRWQITARSLQHGTRETEKRDLISMASSSSVDSSFIHVRRPHLRPYASFLPTPISCLPLSTSRPMTRCKHEYGGPSLSCDSACVCRAHRAVYAMSVESKSFRDVLSFH